MWAPAHSPSPLGARALAVSLGLVGAALVLIHASGCGLRVSSTDGAGTISCLHMMDCPASQNPCVVSTCFEQRCLMISAAANTVVAPQSAGDCRMKVCDGNGAVTDIEDEVDIPPDDGNACTEAACKEGAGVHEPVAVGETCGEKGVCNGKGTCGACLPGKIQCDGNAVATCSEEGQWGKDPCPAGRPICKGNTSGGSCLGMRGLATGEGASCALFEDGSVRCFGAAGRRAEDGLTQVGGVLGAVELAMGAAHGCARLGDGSVMCWGDNRFGQIGDGTDGTTESPRPPTPVLGLAGATRVAAGEAFSCAIIAGGKVVCWGRGDRGELGGPLASAPNARKAPSAAAKKSLELEGFGEPTQNPGGPPTLAPGLAFASSITFGASHACALFTGGRVGCFGDDEHGQLGQFVPESGGKLKKPAAKLKSPLVSVKGVEGAVAISLGGRHACALLGDGTVRCWGDNPNGELGDGAAGARPGPVAVKDLAGISAISLGASHSCARTAGGLVLCWGGNEHGQLGSGSTEPRLSPAAVTDLTSVQKLAAGGNHTCVMLADGPIRCWGGNAAGELGDGATEDRPAPVSVSW